MRSKQSRATKEVVKPLTPAQKAKQKAAAAAWKVTCAKRAKQYKAEDKKREQERDAKIAKFLGANPLPAGIVRGDLDRPSWKAKDGLIADWQRAEFELWFTEDFGWCIPTLLIRGAGRYRTGVKDRTYAIRVRDLSGVRIGLGPHVLASYTVYVRKSRLEALTKYIDMKHTGEVMANQTRDRISSRRMQGSMRRRWW